VRACSATAFNPQSSASFPVSTQTISLSLQPRRNFTVNGMLTAARTELTVLPLCPARDALEALISYTVDRID